MADNERQNRPLEGEGAIIGLLAPLADGFPNAFGLKDDCALLAPQPGSEFILKTDPIVEGVHFLPGDPPRDIAWKALAVNVSDIVAKGAAPLGYLMALAFREPPTLRWMSDFADGLGRAQTAFGCHLMGGDTDRRPGPLTLSISMVGSVPRGGMVRRATARPGDRLFVSGTIGDAALGLALLRGDGHAQAWPLSPADRDWLIGRYRRPEPRLALASVLRRHAAAAMDISDGLVKDLERLLRASGVSGRLNAGAVPLSGPARRLVVQAPERLIQLLTAGDDYEVLAAVSPAKAADFSAAAAAAGVAVAEVGELRSGPSSLTLMDSHGRPLPLPARTGWDHF